jgi:hypothetical protein
MTININSKLISLTFGVLVLLFAVGYYVIMAWTEPTAAPPGANVPAPLNVGPEGQAKVGGLILNTGVGMMGAATTGLIVQHGNVGIGTTAPGARLHVVDNVYFGPAAGGIAGNALSIEDFGTFRRMAFGELRFWDWGGGGDMVTFNDGNVGIGTTDPAGRLHVVGGRTFLADGASIGTTNTFRTLTAADEIHSTGISSGFSLTDRVDGDSAARRWVMFASDNRLHFWTEGFGARMTVTRDGNVGIGTAAPAARLHVAGKARMDGFQLGAAAVAGHVLTADATGVGTWRARFELSGLHRICCGRNGWECRFLADYAACFVSGFHTTYANRRNGCSVHRRLYHGVFRWEVCTLNSDCWVRCMR